MEPSRRQEIGAARRQRTRDAILGAAFDLMGEHGGLFVRVEDISARAGVSRPTFYNHFTGMDALREALTRELTQRFLEGVTQAIAGLPDPREQASAALRLYLEKARADRRWGWSIVNLSAGGVPFGAATYAQAEVTVRAGMQAGVFTVEDSAAGRDLVLGTSLAAVVAMLSGEERAAYPQIIAAAILMGLGVAGDAARAIAARPLPQVGVV
ncbi:TetR family transcriptional regulator [Novosphingobium sp. FSY-8]|uniref:TetR family transcriptional regulator n=1 Tax=Novosphingobium ovatum TaxID=1908523 RepID=A0ABW9XC65_9SPHN|nr:TetR/AcrR family transcriptional regulator [Novosphingobium ovatum]NBC36141.1 TetR family transcriptional regulator [Novosphingobium ovatum]